MFRAAAERAMRASLALPHGGYADQRGTVEQRRILADWLRRSRVALSEDDLILSFGVQHGVHLAFLDLKDTSSLIATEGATYPGAISAARALDVEMVPVRHDSDGMALGRANVCTPVTNAP